MWKIKKWWLLRKESGAWKAEPRLMTVARKWNWGGGGAKANKSGLSSAPQRSPWILSVHLEMMRLRRLQTSVSFSHQSSSACVYFSHWVSQSSYCSPHNSQSRDQLLGQWTATLLEKSADWEDRGLVSPNTFSSKFKFRLLLYLKRRG